jgi:cytochrome c biogenesis protein CcdA/glutaredoxin
MIRMNFKAILAVLLLLSAAMAAESCSIIEQTSCAAADGAQINGTEGSDDGMCLYFFYGLTCPHCAAVEPLVEELAEKYPGVKLRAYEIYYNSTNLEMFKDFNSRYGVQSTGVPSVFIADKALVGESAIEENLETEIQRIISENNTVCPLEYNSTESGDIDADSGLSWWAVIVAALVDSVNPCAFAVLILLMVYLTALNDKIKMLKVGVTYITVIFAVYFLAGLGLLTAVQSTGMTRAMYLFSAGLAIVFGLINIKDFFWYGRGITLAIPKSQKPKIKALIEKASVPAAIVLGMLVSAVELPCTGGVYLAILSLIGSKMTLAQGIPYLLLYNLIFILPLIAIMMLIYFGMSTERAEKLRLENRRWMKLAIGLLMLAIGAAMLSGWI